MSRISFFQLLQDPDTSFLEATAIRASQIRADDAMEVAQAQSDAFGEAIVHLARRMSAQERELALLRASVSVLAAMLRDSGQLDAAMLDLRLEAALENADEALTTAVNTVTCFACHRHVDRRVTVVTEIGVFCDRCHVLGPPRSPPVGEG